MCYVVIWRRFRTCSFGLIVSRSLRGGFGKRCVSKATALLEEGSRKSTGSNKVARLRVAKQCLKRTGGAWANVRAPLSRLRLQYSVSQVSRIMERESVVAERQGCASLLPKDRKHGATGTS